MTPAVTLAVHDGIGHLELNRPDAANTIDMALAEALMDAAQRVAEDGTIQAVLLTGAGPRFCGGGDISAFAGATDPGRFMSELATTADRAVQILEALDKPIVAAVQGAVAGAGLGVMLAADVIVASPDTKFVFAYPAVGLTPDCGTSVSLPRAMGLQRALGFALSGRPLSAEQAADHGLITEVADQPKARARDIAMRWTEGAPGALGATRLLLRRNTDQPRAEAGSVEASTMGSRVLTSEARGLIAAFLGR
jgi:2-(1,2-epoxy-1,2-dihydrophenyl)acetyl-CoA isomerase